MTTTHTAEQIMQLLGEQARAASGTMRMVDTKAKDAALLKAAALLDISRPGFYKKLQKYKMI